MSRILMSRRKFLRAGAAGLAASSLAGCDQFDFLRDRNNGVRQAMISVNELTFQAQRLLMGRDALAREFSETDIRQGQRPNGSTNPRTDEYLLMRNREFADYRLEITGMVDRPTSFSVAELQNMPSRTQITRHDCVEGWSTIAKWTGTPLKAVLDQVGVQSGANYVLFRCFDALSNGLSGPEYYYETIDMIDANHPQTILAYGLNEEPLPVANGAPLRVRVERQLGYKMAKYIKSIELVASFENVELGKGGYWEDRGYEWYAGI